MFETSIQAIYANISAEYAINGAMSQVENLKNMKYIRKNGLEMSECFKRLSGGVHDY